MQAELKGIVNRNQAFEDTLTDEVFSAVSFLPRDVVLVSFLDACCPEILSDEGALGTAEFQFWPPLDNGRCIPDVVLLVGGWVVVIEAKAGATFGVDVATDTHQLVAEWRAARKHWPEASGVIVVAVTDDVVEPPDIDHANAQLGTPDFPHPARWARWADLAGLILAGMDRYRAHEAALATTVLAFMNHRGVPMFTGFDTAAYRSVVEATHTAAQTIYPQMAELASELRTHLEGDGWRWANTGGQGIFGWWGNNGFAQASKWGRTYMALLWTPPGWSAAGFAVALCNFLEPTIDVAWVDRDHRFTSDPQRLADALKLLPGDVEVGFHGPADWASTLKEGARPAPEVTAEWLIAMRQRGGRLRIRRQLSIDGIRSADTVAQQLRDLMAQLEGVGELRALLADDAHAV